MGFNLVELCVVLGIISVVAAGTSAVLVHTTKAQTKMSSRAEMVSTMQMLNRSMAREPSALQTRSCRDMFAFVGAFDPAGRSDISLAPSISDAASPFRAGKVISVGNNTATIGSLYIDNVQLLSTSPGNNESNYLATMFMTTVVDGQTSRPRSMGTITIKYNTANQQYDCNRPIEASHERDTCNAISGREYNEATGECDERVEWVNGAQLECPSGTNQVGTSCVPQPASCPRGQLLSSIATDDFLITNNNCETPPLNDATGLPPANASAPLIVAPNTSPTPQEALQPSDTTYTRSPATTDIPATTDGTTYNGSCNDPRVVDQQTYDACAAVPGCLDADSIRAPDNCSGESTTAPYTPPASSTPSVEPPPDRSCACNNYRIAHGEYCMYCVEDIDLGYGSYDYTYGVAECRNGALEQVDASMATNPPYCGGYAPAYRDRTTNRYYQIRDGRDLMQAF